MEKRVEIHCLNCGYAQYILESALQGDTVKCPKCKINFPLKGVAAMIVKCNSWLNKKQNKSADLATDLYVHLNGYMHTFFSDFFNEKRFATAFWNFIEKEQIDGTENSNQIFEKISALQKYEAPTSNLAQQIGVELSAEESARLEEELKKSLEKPIVSRQTVFNYLNKDNFQPGYTQKGRCFIFALCFALGLSAEQTRLFFETVYFDRIDSCLPEEVFYVYCLRNRLSYCDAKRMFVYYQYLQFKQTPSAKDTNIPDARDTEFFAEALRSGTPLKEIFSELLEKHYTFEFQNHRIVKVIRAKKEEIRKQACFEGGKRNHENHEDCQTSGEHQKEKGFYEKWKERNLQAKYKRQETIKPAGRQFLDALPRAEYIKFFVETPVSYEEMSFYDIRNHFILVKFWDHFLKPETRWNNLSEDADVYKQDVLAGYFDESQEETYLVRFLKDTDRALMLYNMNPLNENNIFDRFIICIALAVWKENNPDMQPNKRAGNSKESFLLWEATLSDRRTVVRVCIDELLTDAKACERIHDLYQVLRIDLDADY